MSPGSIVDTAILRGLDMIAISDHNTTQNVQPVIDRAKNHPLTVLPAIEISSREEVHILSIYETLESAKLIQEKLYESIGKTDNPSVVDEQIIANQADEVEGFCPYLLLNATQFSVKQIVEMVHQVGGLAIAAHIDRQAFSIIGQLGFIPPQIPFDALEVSSNLSLDAVGTRFPEYARYQFVTNSDAHFLHDIGKVYNTFTMEEPTFINLANALRSPVSVTLQD